MWNKLLLHWWVLPLCSAAALMLAFHPFDLWPLAFVALVPLYYFAAGFPGRPLRQIFYGGFITGGLFALSLSFFTVLQFRWVAGAYLFIDLVHLSFIPIAILGGLMCGGGVVLYRLLRSGSPLLNILVGAAAYVAAEMLLYALSGGYYFAMLGYAAAQVPWLLSLAAVGGAFFVSFLVALVSVALVEVLAAPARRPATLRAAVLVAAVAALWAANAWYLRPGPVLRELSVATIQAASEESVGFGKADKSGNFFFPALAAQLKSAGQGAPDLLMYPFSPVEGALYDGHKDAFDKPILVASQKSFESWLGPLVPASTTVMVWTTLYKSPHFYNVFEFLRGGSLAAQYTKRDIFPFIDYTPQWAQRAGFYTTQIDMTRGDISQSVSLAGFSVSALLCSEIHQQSLARADAALSPIIISAGSEAIFVDDVASEYSLKAAQFRAAENDRPAIRANLLGPSALINSDGSVLARLNRGEGGVLRGVLPVRAPRQTLFNRWGNAGVSVLVFAVLFGAFAVRIRSRYNREHD